MGLTGYASIWLDEDFSKLVTPLSNKNVDDLL